MSDFFIGELLVLILLFPVLLRPFVRSLQAIRGIVFLPVTAFCLCLLIIAGSGFPLSFTPVFILTFVLCIAGCPRMIRALYGLATDWYSLPTRVFYLVFLPVFFGVVLYAFFFAPESIYLGSDEVAKAVTVERPAAGVLVNRHEWRPAADKEIQGTVVFFGDTSAGALSRSTLAYILSESGYLFLADEYRNFYSWSHPLMAWPSVRHVVLRAGMLFGDRVLLTNEEEIHYQQRRFIARTMTAVTNRSTVAPLYLVAEGRACVPAAEYLRVAGSSIQGLVCLVAPQELASVTAALDQAGFEGQYTMVPSEESMIPRHSAYFPVLVLSGDQGSTIGRGELDSEDVLVAAFLGASRDRERKGAERLSRRIRDWFVWRHLEEEALNQ